MAELRTPYFLVDEERLVRNLEILKDVSERSGAKILLAQKAFSMFACYPLLAQYLSGSTASGLYEARLGKEHFPGEVHVFSPAYREDEFEALLQYADHFVFNSPRQLEKYARRARAAGKQVGLRVNPSAPPRRDTPSTTPAPPAPGWAPPWSTSNLSSCRCWTGSTSTPSANKTPTIWRPPWTPLRQSSDPI